MKYILALTLILTMLAGRSYAQYDSIAIAILDSMSNEISQLETCSFKFYSEYDISNNEFGLITHSETGSVSMKGPDKMYIEKKGDKGQREIFYNGKTFIIYSVDRNKYASVEASMSIIELIDSLSSYFGVEFPGADVFYPDFVDNLLETSNNLVFLGQTLVGDTECNHIAGADDEKTFQIWTSTGENSLPVKMTINYITKPGNPRYSIYFKDWKPDEQIDDAKFEFSVPAGAELVKLIK